MISCFGQAFDLDPLTTLDQPAAAAAGTSVLHEYELLRLDEKKTALFTRQLASRGSDRVRVTGLDP